MAAAVATRTRRLASGRIVEIDDRGRVVTPARRHTPARPAIPEDFPDDAYGIDVPFVAWCGPIGAFTCAAHGRTRLAGDERDGDYAVLTFTCGCTVREWNGD